jgi:hypothetical protein
MINDIEFNQMITEVSTNFIGQLDDLQAAVGLLVLGRLYGWRVMRLISSTRHWSVTTRIFGDPKQLLPERGILAHKSQGLKIVDQAGIYWEFIKGHVSRDDLPVTIRRSAS